MMRIPIVIEFIPHQSQRYDTCGDWQIIESPAAPTDPYESQLPSNAKQRHLKISISQSEDARTDYALAIHELVEALLCERAHITTSQVDTFDLQHEKLVNPKYAEPGDDPKAPYYHQHQTATTVERIFVAATQLSWHDHNENIDRLVR